MSAEALDAVARTIVAIERSCIDADAAFTERRWDDVDAALRAQASLTGDLAALFEATPEHSPQRDAKVAQRVGGILAYRDDQLRRMRAYREGVHERLRSIRKVNALSRSLGRRVARAGVVDGQY